MYETNIKLPSKLRPVFQGKYRYRVARGGRGGGKSKNFATMALIRAMQERTRILCCREYQNSIRDSVLRMLTNQIEFYSWQKHFDIGRSYLRAKNTGTEFIFKGLNRNAEEIKSMEGIGVAWLEEAQRVSHRSWELIIPTVRDPGSEIWVTYNPDLETDPTHKRFAINPPPNCVSAVINWYDNPWFPQELEDERKYLLGVDPDGYEHIWNGGCRASTAEQVFHGKWVVMPFEPEHNWDGPYFGADWGFSVDPTCLIKMWISGQNLYIEREAYATKIETDDMEEFFNKIDGSHSYRIWADSARPEMISHMKRRGFNVRAADKWEGSLKDGVSFLRSFKQIIIHPRCDNTIVEAKLYSHKKDRLTNDILPDIVDRHNHAWDAIRYGLSPIIKRKGNVGAL